MRSLFVKKIVGIGLFFPIVAIGGQINNATVTRMTNFDDGLVRITLSGGSDVKEKAACSISKDGREFVYDLNTVSGKGWHSVALTALVSAKPVHVIGKNTCDILWGSHEYEKISVFYIMK